MFRSFIVLAAIVGVLLAVSLPAPLVGGPHGIDGRFEGTWVHWASFGPGMRYPALVTMDSDGTLTVNGGSGIHGVWQRTGNRTVEATSFLHVTNANGALVGLERHRCLLHYSDDLSTYDAVEFAETVACPSPFACPDPLDPATVWTPVQWAPPTGIPVHAVRAQVVPFAPLP